MTFARGLIKTIKQNDFIRTVIEDDGGGIPMDVVEKIFDPYFATKFRSQGTGVWLYMAKTIIETNMQGKIDAANTDGGAVFTIDIPITENCDK